MELGLINHIMEITIFYIDDKLDLELIYLLKYCLICLNNCISGSDQDCKKQIIDYKNCIIIKILSKALKLELKDFIKDKLPEKMIISINLFISLLY